MSLEKASTTLLSLSPDDSEFNFESHWKSISHLPVKGRG